MLFNSIEFFIFLPIVFTLYWLINNFPLRVQNLLLLVASFIFYGWWDWRFLLLLVFSAGIDFFVALELEQTEDLRKRKYLLAFSLAGNLGILGFFKYFNFFAQSFHDAFTFFGGHIQPVSLSIVLPVGVSFYTFQALSYTIDVYRRKIKPVNDPITYFTFVSFFPQLVAGPIERAAHMLPQYLQKRKFDYDFAADGMRRILWGLLKKMVIADNCAVYVNEIFNHATANSGSTLCLGAVLFAFQIYGDFSGYSDIAIGTAKLFGFQLMQNFSFPFFSKNITEFWRRWHISLSSWFNNYVFQPLVIYTRNWGNEGIAVSLLITFFLAGLWHGAGWTFVIYGLLHGVVLVYEFYTGKVRKKVVKKIYLPLYNSVSVVFTFIFFCFSLIFFRANSIRDAIHYVVGIFSRTTFSIPDLPANKSILFLIPLLMVTEWFQRNKNHGLEMNPEKIKGQVRWLIYYLLVLILFRYAAAQQPFIYFQF